MGNPAIPVPGTVTPIPFFIKLGETHASIPTTGSANNAVAFAAANANEIGSVQPTAGLTPSRN